MKSFRKRQKELGSEIILVRHYKLPRGWLLKKVHVGVLSVTPGIEGVKIGHYRFKLVGPFKGSIKEA